MDKSIVLAITLIVLALIIFKEAKSNHKKNNSKKDTLMDNVVIIDNDCHDEDFVPLVQGAIHLDRYSKYKVHMIVTCNQKNNCAYALYNTILKYYNSNIPLWLHKGDRLVNSRHCKGIDKYPGYIPDNKAPNAIKELEKTLRQSKDKSVKYLTGGELYTLRDFLRDKNRRDLFYKKVSEVLVATGCNINDNNCKDFNLAKDENTANATREVFKYLKEGSITIGNVNFKDRDKLRVYDYYKNKPDSPIKHILANGQYRTFGNIPPGDIEVIMVLMQNPRYKLANIYFDGRKLRYNTVNMKDKIYSLQNSRHRYLREVIKSLEEQK